MKTLDDFVKGSVRRWQNQRMLDVINRASMLAELERRFPSPPPKPLTLRERMARDLRWRAERLRDALKVLRGEASIADDDY